MEWTLFSIPFGRSGQTCWMWWASTVSFTFIMTLLAKKDTVHRERNVLRDLFLSLLSLSFHCSLKPQPLLQPHISHQLSSTCPSPGRRCALGLLVPFHVPGGFLLPAARCVRPLLLAGTCHALRPVLPLHPAEVWRWPWACSATTVLHHGGVFHDRACGSILASGRRCRFIGRENRPPGHSDQAA